MGGEKWLSQFREWESESVCFKMKLSIKNSRLSYAGVLRQVIEKCIAGASVIDLCELGDQMILEETSKVYKKEKEMKKGRVA